MSNVKIIFSRHAKRRMKWRGITEEDVKSTILLPEKTEDAINDRNNAFRHIGRKWIKVTFKQEGETVKVITAVDKNK